ncbi:MAG: sugar epimerase [Pedobacter sp.]|nr:MAG: sugar epimerase [Pedobacter sp.]
MTTIPTLINGGEHVDQRGSIKFFNDFDMREVKRFYCIQNKDTSVVRAWRGHKIEQRWFTVIEGEFLIRFVKIDDWAAPSKDLHLGEFTLSANHNQVLHMPAGYATWIEAKKEHSSLMVFADHDIDHAPLDDYVYPVSYFTESKVSQ